MVQPQILFELGYQISGFLGLLDKYYFDRALASSSVLSPESTKCGRVWAMVFKDSIWLEKALEAGLRPALFGYTLTALHEGKQTPANLALVISDWDGNSLFFEDDFFKSLHEHKYDEKRFQVRLKSGITLNIHDIVKCLEGIFIAKPKRLFQQRREGVFSTVLYYGERTLLSIEPQYIGGINGVGPTKRSEVKDICAVRFRFANGKPVYRTLMRQGATTKVIPIKREASDDVVAYKLPSGDENGAPVYEHYI